MRTSLRLCLVAFALSALAFVVPAEAASIRVCSPIGFNGTPPTQFKAPNSSNLYTVDSRGCFLVPYGDLGDARAAGFIPSDTVKSLVVSGIGALDFTSIVIPAGAFITGIIVDNSTANAVTGGLDFGTTSAGTDVISALACAANCLVPVVDSAILKRVFSRTVATPISITAHTSWNSAKVNVTIFYGYF